MLGLLTASLNTFVAVDLSTTTIVSTSLHSSFKFAADPPISTIRFSLDFDVAPAVVRRASTIVSSFLVFPPQPLPVFFTLVKLRVPSLLQLPALVALSHGFSVQFQPLVLLVYFQFLLLLSFRLASGSSH